MSSLRNLVGDLLDYTERFADLNNEPVDGACRATLRRGQAVFEGNSTEADQRSMVAELAGYVQRYADMNKESANGDCRRVLKMAELARTSASEQQLIDLSTAPSDINPTGMAVANEDILFFNGLTFWPVKLMSSSEPPLDGVTRYYRHDPKGIHLYDERGLRAYLVNNAQQGQFIVSASEHDLGNGRKTARYMHSTSSLEEQWLDITDRGMQDQTDLIKAAHFFPLVSKPSLVPKLPKRSIRVMSFGDTSYWPQSLAQAFEVVDAIIAKRGAGLVEQRTADGTWSITHRFAPEVGLVAEPPKTQGVEKVADATEAAHVLRKRRP